MPCHTRTHTLAQIAVLTAPSSPHLSQDVGGQPEKIAFAGNVPHCTLLLSSHRCTSPVIPSRIARTCSIQQQTEASFRALPQRQSPIQKLVFAAAFLEHVRHEGEKSCHTIACNFGSSTDKERRRTQMALSSISSIARLRNLAALLQDGSLPKCVDELAETRKEAHERTLTLGQ